jgi:hypothetical protein
VQLVVVSPFEMPRRELLDQLQGFPGVMMPTTHRICAYDDAMQNVSEPFLVAVDFGALTFS